MKYITKNEQIETLQDTVTALLQECSTLESLLAKCELSNERLKRKLEKVKRGGGV